MIVGTVREIKKHEYRVGLTPACVKAYVARGHEVWVEKGAGQQTGFPDDAYKKVGAHIAGAEEIFAKAEMIVKVKEPQAGEIPLIRNGQIIYTYLHLAADKNLTLALMERKCHAIAYETIETNNGHLPCLKPMSEIAGRLAVQEGAKYLERTFGGKGILLGGVPGVRRGKVVILGAGTVGTNACKIAIGIGADVTVLDISAERMAYLDDIFGSAITTLYCTESNIESAIREADVVIGAVLIPGSAAPKLIRSEHLKLMKPGTVIVDVAIDQGGCFETSHPTCHDDPIFIIDDIVHYCVANMPGAVALSSTLALTSTTLPYGLLLADLGLDEALKASPPLQKGLNLLGGRLTHRGVAESHGMVYDCAF